MVTIDEAIKFLERAKAKVGGDKLLILSLSASGIEDAEVTGLRLENDRESKYVEVQVSHPALSQES